MKTGLIGLGAMGIPMAKNLATHKLLYGLWNRSADKAVALAAELGCINASSPEQLAADCDVIVLCVSADRDVLELCGRLAGAMSAGSVIVDCSTVSASTAREAAAMLSQYGIGFLDCPVSGGTEGAKKGSLAIMVGGEESDLSKARPALEAIGGTIRHMGPSGAGQATKATNQIMVAGINQAVTEALAFARQQGLPMDDLITLLSTGAAGNWFLEHRGPTMVRNEFPLGFKVELHQKDLEICREMAATLGVKLPIVEMTMLHYRRLLDAGHRNEDISSLFRVKAQMFDKEGEGLRAGDDLEQ